MIVPKTAPELQGAFDKSGLTGEPVWLDRRFDVPGDLYTNGATIQCPPYSPFGNWNVGTGQIRFAKGKSLYITAHTVSTKCPVVENLTTVFSHADSRDAAGWIIACDGAVLNAPLVDGAGSAMYFNVLRKGARVTNAFITGAFTSGIDGGLSPHLTADHYFLGTTWIMGHTHDDYGGAGRKFPNTQYAIRNWPGTTVIHDLLTNFCRTGIRLQSHIHGVLGYGFFDSHEGPVFEVAADYTGQDVNREFSARELHAAAVGKDQAFYAVDSEKPPTAQKIIIGRLSAFGSVRTTGSWNMVVPKGVVRG